MSITTADKIFCEKLEAMERLDLNRLNLQDFTWYQKRLINEEKIRRKREESKATTEILMKMLEVLRPNEVAKYRARYQNQSLDTGPEPGESRPPRAKRSQNSVNSADTPSGKANDAPRSCYTFGNYHKKVSRQVKDVTFADDIHGQTGLRLAKTNLVGSFICPNPPCRQKWKTGIIPTVIQGVHGPENSIKYNALVYNQRCGACKSLGIMKLDEDIYVERVVRRLKIWKGEFTPSKFKQYFKRGLSPYHDQELCEGCQVGNCQKAIYDEDRLVSRLGYVQL